MTVIFKAYQGATLPAHNATTTDLGWPDAGSNYRFVGFANSVNNPEPGTTASTQCQVVSVNGEPWVRFTNPSTYIRSEATTGSSGPGIADGTTCWHAISFILRQGDLVVGGGTKLANLTQVHQSFPPPIGIYMDRPSSGTYRFRYAMKPGGSDKNITTFSTLPYDERLDVIFKVFYTHGSTGSMSCFWRRASDITDFTGAWQSPLETMPNGANMNSGTGLYFKQGCYRPDHPGDGSTWIVDHKGYIVSKLDGSTTDSEARAEVEELYGTATNPPDPDPPPDATRVGVSVAGSSFNTMGADRVRLSTFTMPEDGLINEVVCYMDGNGGTSGSQTFKYVVYSGTTKVAETGDITISSSSPNARWEDENVLVPYQASDGESLSIGIQSSTTANVARYAYEAETDALLFGTDTYADGAEATLPSTTLDAKRMSIYAVYTPGSVEPPPPPSTGNPRGYVIGGRLYVASRRAYAANSKSGTGGGV